MAKLNDLCISEVKDAILDKKGRVLCKKCQKRLANVTHYGMIRNCNECGENPIEKYGMVIMDEPGGRKYY